MGWRVKEQEGSPEALEEHGCVKISRKFHWLYEDIIPIGVKDNILAGVMKRQAWQLILTW